MIELFCGKHVNGGINTNCLKRRRVFMLNKMIRVRVGLVLLLGLPLCLSSTLAMAQDDRGGHWWQHKNHDSNHGGDRHHYRDGKWYRHDSAGHDILVASLALGALVEALPPRHTTVVVHDTPYYYDNEHYYRPAPGGVFVVVDAPRR